MLFLEAVEFRWFQRAKRQGLPPGFTYMEETVLQYRTASREHMGATIFPAPPTRWSEWKDVLTEREKELPYG